MAFELSQELDLLNEVYCEEMEIKPSQNFVKLRIKCLPLLEDQNMDHHYEYDHPYLFANFELPLNYPTESPKFYLESTHGKVGIGSFLAEITEKMMNLSQTMKGDPCILDLVELIRMQMYNEIAKKNKNFKKRKHILSDEPAYLYDDDDEDLEENLMKKTEYTEVTQERFAAWLAAFRAEMRMKQEKDPVYLRRKMILGKSSGRMIFSDRTKEFANYFDDEKNEDDDEDVDLKKEMIANGDEGDEEEVDIDEDLFGDEDDLEDDEELQVYD